MDRPEVNLATLVVRVLSETGRTMALFFVIITATILDSAYASPLHVIVAQGTVEGCSILSPVTEQEYFAWLGIPYAKPPVGELRFQEPQPPDTWDGVWNATEEGSICFQNDEGDDSVSFGEEDCLYLNVYTPQLPMNGNSSLRTVMVWIHGGGFVSGSGSSSIHSPDYFMSEDVVVVTLNYRLGMLGFLKFGDDIHGNMGLKDQVAALKWVQENIARFGGDPSKVTIFGESAGAASVHFLMISPMAKGLFQHCICQSGTSLAPWAYKPSVEENSKILVEAVGCGNLEEDETKTCLRNIPLANFSSIGPEQSTSEDQWRLIPNPVKVTIDGKFLPRDPYEMLKDGDFNKVPLLIGVNSGEALMWLDEAQGWIEKDFERLTPDLNLQIGTECSKRCANMLNEIYFNGEQVNLPNLNKFVDMSSDRLFVVPTHRAVQIQAKTSDQPIFLYRFAFEGTLGIFKAEIFGNDTGLPGVCHADDLGYMWYMELFPVEVSPDSAEMLTLRRMVTMWTNFAKIGNPTPNITDTIPVTWQAYTQENPCYLDIDKNLTMKVHIEEERMKFWDNLYTEFKNCTE